MNWKMIAIAAAGAALLGASPAFANPPHWAPAYGWHAKHRHHYRPRPPVVIFAPGPVIYGQVPVSPGVHVSFGVRL